MRNLAVDYLKFTAVLCIVVDHFIEVFYGFNWLIWLLGAFGVSLFVYSAGFLAAKTNMENFSVKQYMLKRFLRLYPLYLVASVLVIAYSNIPISQQLSSVFMIYPIFWFVPIILLFYFFYGLFRVNVPLFRVAVSLYYVVLIAVSVYVGMLGDFRQVLFNLYWLFLLGLFFIGANAKLEFKLPDWCFVKTISGYSYHIYLFQAPFLIALSTVGLIGFAYVGLAVAVFFGLKKAVV